MAWQAYKVFSDMGHPVAFGGCSVILGQAGLHIGLGRSGLIELWDQIPAHLRVDDVDTTRGVPTVFPALTLALIRVMPSWRAMARERPAGIFEQCQVFAHLPLIPVVSRLGRYERTWAARERRPVEVHMRGRCVQATAAALAMNQLMLPAAAAYSASKHFVDGFSEALRADLAGTGVVVTQVCPGPVDSDFDAIAGTAGGMTGGPPQFLRISAARCVREALAGFDAGKPLVFPGRAYRITMRALPLLPRSLQRHQAASFAAHLRSKAAHAATGSRSVHTETPKGEAPT